MGKGKREDRRRVRGREKEREGETTRGIAMAIAAFSLRDMEY